MVAEFPNVQTEHMAYKNKDYIQFPAFLAAWPIGSKWKHWDVLQFEDILFSCPFFFILVGIFTAGTIAVILDPDVGP